MTDVPIDGSDVDPDDGQPTGEAAPGPSPTPQPYPPVFTPDAHVGDDELASALAAQTAMYTGPITIPILNSDPAFRPDPAAADPAVPPPAEFAEHAPAAVPGVAPVTVPGAAPVPVPDAAPVADAPRTDLPPVPPSLLTGPVEVVVPDDFAAEVESRGTLAPDDKPGSPAEPAGPVEPQGESVSLLGAESPAAPAEPLPVGVTESSTLDAILRLEEELRRRTGEIPESADAFEQPAASVWDTTPPAPAADPAPAIDPAADASAPVDSPPLTAWNETDAAQAAPTLEQLLRAATPPVAADASFAPPPPAFAAPQPPLAPEQAAIESAPPVVDQSPFMAPSPSPEADVAPEPTDAAPAVPGWTPAPDPAQEGSVGAADTSAHPWLAAPPPVLPAAAPTPPALVEPPMPASAAFDPAILSTPPAPGPSPAQLGAPPTASQIDVTTLPPPGAVPPQPVSVPAVFAPSDFFGASAAGSALPASGFDATEDEGIDDVDRVGVAAGIAVEPTAAAVPPPAPAGEAPGGEAESVASEPRDPHPFAVERASTIPTPLEERAGRAARMFWLWFAANSSFLVVAVGATMLAMGLSLRQALVATLLGVVLSVIPLSLGTRAGKWSGQPTMVVSRATFGRVGNIIPALLSIIGRAFWGGVVMWLLVVSLTPLVLGRELESLSPAVLIALAVSVTIAALVAVVGFGLLYRVQRVLSILSTLLLAATIVLTVDEFDASVILRTSEATWVMAIGGAVLVFSVVGLAWAQSSSDLARYQRPGTSTGATSVWSIVGTVVPTLAIISWGAILAASNPALVDTLSRQPLEALLGLVPTWFVIPLAAAAGIGLLSAAIVCMYSGGLAINALGVRMPRAIATVLAAILVAAAGFLLLVIGADARDIVQDLATTLAVPVAAWAGLFAGEMMLRRRPFHSPSLLAAGGVYPAVRWGNLLALLVITGIGFGFTTAAVAGLEWQGYLLSALGFGSDDAFAVVDSGVILALILGLLFSLAAGLPAVRRQERRSEATGTAGMPVVDALVD